METHHTTLGAKANPLMMNEGERERERVRARQKETKFRQTLGQIDLSKVGSRSLSLPCLDLYFSDCICQAKRDGRWKNKSAVM